jgi:hypothetical protein
MQQLRLQKSFHIIIFLRKSSAMLSFVIGTLLCVWFLLSVLNQFSFSFINKTMARLDRLYLLPVWTFFAPNPGCTDYRLVYRDIISPELPSSWNEIPLVQERKCIDAFWNPDKRRSKAVFDLVQSLLIFRSKNPDSAAVMISLPYIALLHYVGHLPRRGDVKYRQFMIVQTHGIFTDANLEILMRSEIHSV